MPKNFRWLVAIVVLLVSVRPPIATESPSAPEGQKALQIVTAAIQTNQVFQLQAGGTAHETYTVERSSDLVTWSPIGSLAGGADLVPFLDTNRATETFFYRLRKSDASQPGAGVGSSKRRNLRKMSENVPPTASLTFPTNNSVCVAPTNITLTATASDSDGTVTQVVFYAGTTVLGTVASSPYSLVWSNVFEGAYTLTAVATDDAGAHGTSSPVNITVTVPASDTLRLWLKADAITGVSSGGALSTWLDNSGRTNNATQSTGGNQPTWVTNVFNGRPVVRFDGVNDSLTFADFMAGATQAEVYVVTKIPQDPPSGGIGIWSFGTQNYGDHYPAPDGVVYDGFGSTVRKTTGDPTQGLDQIHLYNVVTRLNEWTSRINGVTHFSTSDNAVAFRTNPTLGYSVSGHPYPGDIAEILIYERTLSSDERYALGTYLNSKYSFMAVPAAPTNLTATAISTNQISLVWSNSLATRPTRVTVERKVGSGGTYAEIAALENSASYIDRNLAAATEYYYRVRASSYGTASAYSNEANATTLSAGEAMPLTDLRLWLKGDSGIVGGINISQWQDQSGRNNHASQISGASQPILTNAINARPVVRFDGVNDYFAFGNVMSAATQAEVFVVMKVTQDPPVAATGLWSFGTETDGDPYPYTDGVIYDGFGSTARKTTGDPAQRLDQVHLYNVLSRSGEWTSRINGMTHFTISANSVNFVTSPTLGYTVSGQVFSGDMAEVLIYERPLTSGERDTVGFYLNTKYNFLAVPEAPTNLTAKAISTNQISLVWSNPPTAATAKLKLERKLGSGGTYAEVATLERSGSYIDSGLAASTEYFYRVRASNYAGDSGYSNEASDTTGGDPAMPLTDLRLWLKADAGIARSGTNNRVNCWLSQSGNAIVGGIQPTPANQPLLVESAINGRPAVRFDGTNDYLNLPNFLNGTTQAEMFIVLKATADTPGTARGSWCFGSDIYYPLYPYTDGTITDGFGSTNKYNIGNPAQALDQAHLFNVAAVTGEWTARMNGLAQYITANNVYGYTTSPQLGITYGWYAETYFFAGDVAELLIYDRVLNSDERDAVGNYLTIKYGLAGSASSTNAPSTPTNLLATGLAPSQLKLTWSRASTNESSFRVERKLGSGGTYALLATIPQGGTNFTDTTAVATNQYFYRVKGHNLFGESSYSSVISPPTASITNWTLPAIATIAATNAIIAQATDADGSVAQVELFVNTRSMGVPTNAPYSTSWIAYQPQTFSLTAKATDNQGNTQISSTLPVTVYPDTDGDGVNDGLDVFPLDSTRWEVPASDPDDHTPPLIYLIEPTNAVLLP